MFIHSNHTTVGLSIEHMIWYTFNYLKFEIWNILLCFRYLYRPMENYWLWKTAYINVFKCILWAELESWWRTIHNLFMLIWWNQEIHWKDYTQKNGPVKFWLCYSFRQFDFGLFCAHTKKIVIAAEGLNYSHIPLKFQLLSSKGVNITYCILGAKMAMK